MDLSNSFSLVVTQYLSSVLRTVEQSVPSEYVQGSDEISQRQYEVTRSFFVRSPNEDNLEVEIKGEWNPALDIFEFRVKMGSEDFPGRTFSAGVHQSGIHVASMIRSYLHENIDIPETTSEPPSVDSEDVREVYGILMDMGGKLIDLAMSNGGSTLDLREKCREVISKVETLQKQL